MVSQMAKGVKTNNKGVNNIRIETNGAVQNDQNINYRAGQELELMIHFEIKPDAMFHAFVALCAQ